MPIYEELENYRKELYIEYKKDNKIASLSLLGVVLGVLLLVLSFNMNIDPGPIFLIAMILFVGSFIVSSIFYSKANKHKKKFDRKVKDSFVISLLRENFDEPSFFENGSVGIEKINSAGLVQRPDRFKGEDLITGTYKDVLFQVSDVVLTERRVVSNGKNTYVQYIDYFKGRWYVYKFPKNFKQTIKIVETTMGVDTRGLKKYETEMIDFNKKFRIYSSDEHFFFYLMNPFLIEKLLLLENSHRGSIHYAFKNNELHIGINDNSNSLQLNFKNEVNKDSVQRFVEDIVLIKTIIDELRLYDTKFRE